MNANREEIYHLQFPQEYLLWKPKHAQWHETFQTIEERPYRFGGIVNNRFCTCCGGGLHHLLTFPAASLLPNSCSLPSLTLATCTNCMGWEVGAAPLFLHHSEYGVPIAPAPESPKEPQFNYYAPFQEARIALTLAEPRYHRQEWGDPDYPNLHRLGGHPSWVQGDYYPDCPDCQRAMTFLLQLDSNLPVFRTDTKQLVELLWGSGGIAYFYWCDSCRISAGNWQCT